MKRTRYLIPFTWSEPYETMYNCLLAADGWTCLPNAHAKTASRVDYKEQDIFEHILTSFSDDKNNTHAVGSVWMREVDPNRPIKTLTWFPKRPEDGFYEVIATHDTSSKKESQDSETVQPDPKLEKYDINIYEMGIYLFRNRVGLLWYEMDQPKKKRPGVSEMTSINTLVEFQYFIKELNRRERSRNSAALYERVEKISFPEAEKDVFLGSLRQKEERAAGFTETNVTPKNNQGEVVRTVRGTLYLEFTLGDWIGSELEKIARQWAAHIECFVGKTNIFRSDDDKAQYDYRADVPDKANLFSYVTFNASDLVGKPETSCAKVTTDKTLVTDDLQSGLSRYAYMLANGYKSSYLAPDDVRDEQLFLFANVCCSASQEGCGYFVIPTDENRGFFEGNMKDKVMLDYFLLYVLALHQHYSLIQYARMISERLSAEPDDYTDSTELKESLTEIVSEINTFFVKNVSASVSMIAHQNDFYEYVLERLRVRKNIESVRIGLDAIYKIQLRFAAEEDNRQRAVVDEKIRKREERAQEADRSLNMSVAILSLLAVISALVDGHELISILSAGKTGTILTYPFYMGLYVVLFVVVAAAFAYVVRHMIKLRSKKSEEQ